MKKTGLKKQESSAPHKDKSSCEKISIREPKTILPDGSVKASDELLTAILTILQKQGIKGTTMDSVAAALSMSKRTLYEIFTSKRDMALTIFDHNVSTIKQLHEKIYEESPDVLVTILRIFRLHRDMMSNISPSFFKDMEEYYPELHLRYRKDQKQVQHYMQKFYRKGVCEGVLRPNINFPLSCSLMMIQMEALKHIEQYFPEDIDILEAYDAICIGFMRSIASPEGMERLDRFTSGFTPGIFTTDPEKYTHDNIDNNIHYL